MTQLVMRLLVLLYLLVLATLAQNCQNGGTPLNATSCQCPAYVGGQYCETVKCQRWGIPDKNRCACAPGWYDNYCGIRGCRPPNEDNLDHSKRSIIIVFNMKKSMAEQLKTLKDNLKSMVGGITKSWNNGNQTENWIENFIIYGFVQVNQTMKTTQLITDNADDVVTFLGNMQQNLQYDGDATQSVLTAVKNSQQLFPQMKSHSLILVFTDSPASEATAWSHRFEERNSEQLCLQISFLWRSKVSYILSFPAGTNTTSDGVDVYKRLSLSTHGDYFLVSSPTETADILNNVISTYFFPENVAVGFKANSDLVIVPTADNLNDWVFTLITKDSSDYVFPSIPQSITIAQGTNYKLVAGRNMTVVTVSGVKDVFNYRTFLQSKNNLLFDYNSDMTIDVGNGIVHLGVTMYSTIRTFGFPEYKNMTYHVMQNGKQVREQYVAYKRPQEDCTFEMAFPPWVNTNECPPGPITQVHVLNYEGFYKSRVTPGYCDEIAHYTPQQQGYMAPVPAISTVPLTRKRRDATGTCSAKNTDAIDDPRLKKANQFVFILEQHLGNQNIYKTLANEIDQILFLMDSNNSLEYTKEFSLIVNDDDASRVLLSTYNRDVFAKKFRILVNNLKYQSKLDHPAGLRSVVQAMKSNIRPTAQVYYFTNQAVKTMKNDTKLWDIISRDLEFNFFTISDNVTTEVFALPPNLELVQKMSNGRIIPLEGKETTLVNIFADMINMHTLSTDSQKYDCLTSPFVLDTFIEKGARSTVFQVVGTGLTGLSITDAAGKAIPVSETTHFANSNFRSLLIDTSMYTSGTWKVSVGTSRGGCQISVRHQSTTGVIYGFAANSSSDYVNTQIPLQRSSAVQREQLYVPIRIQQRVDNPTKVATTNMEIQIVNRSRYDQPVSHSNTTIYTRDSSTCSYSYITPKVSVPQNELTAWTLTSYDDSNNLILRRVYYYYQHFPAETSVCHGGQVDSFGMCICPSGYTGEYCWDRICAPGATLSFGICSCSSGFYGDFCELELMMPNATTAASTLSPTSNPLQTTTKFSFPSSGLFSVLLITIVHALFL